MGHLFELVAELESLNADIDPAALVGQKFIVSLELPDGRHRHFNAIMQRFTRASQSGRAAADPYGTTAKAASRRSTVEAALSSQVVQPSRLPAGEPSASTIAPPSRLIGPSAAANTGRTRMS